MTTIISRLYDSLATAEAAADALRAAGHAPATLSVIPAEGSAPAARIAAAGVGHVSAAAYARAMAPGMAVLAVRAPFVPFGRARSAMAIADRFDPLPVAGARANQHVPDQPDPVIFFPAIARHAHVLTRDIPPHIGRRRGLVSAAFGLPLLLAPRRHRLLPTGPLTGGLLPHLWRRRPQLVAPGFASRWFWPLPLLSRRRA